MAKNVLETKVKNYIVIRLALRLSPSYICKRVKTLFEVKITLQGINAYHPETKTGQRLSPELKYMFYALRELYYLETQRSKIQNAKDMARK